MSAAPPPFPRRLDPPLGFLGVFDLGCSLLGVRPGFMKAYSPPHAPPLPLPASEASRPEGTQVLDGECFASSGTWSGATGQPAWIDEWTSVSTFCASVDAEVELRYLRDSSVGSRHKGSRSATFTIKLVCR